MTICIDCGTENMFYDSTGLKLECKKCKAVFIRTKSIQCPLCKGRGDYP